MRVNEKTKKLAKIRMYIRQAIMWHKVDGGFPEMWTSDDYRKSKKVPKGSGGSDFYYSKSDRAIKDIAEKIYALMDENLKGKNEKQKQSDKKMIRDIVKKASKGKLTIPPDVRKILLEEKHD